MIIRPSALGDVCRTVPVLASLRRAYPQARIDWVVQQGFAAAVEGHPALNEVVTFPRGDLSNWWSPGAAGRAVKWLRSLRRRQYDLVLDCQGLGRSGVMCWATGAKVRAGLRRAREFAWLAYNFRCPRDRSQPLPQHTVDQMLLLVEDLGIEPVRDLRLYLGDAHAQWWREERDGREMAHSPYAVIAPTARWPAKRWPIERFMQLLQPLRDRGFERVVIIGAPGEDEQVTPLLDVASKLKAPEFLVNLVGSTSVGQTMAVIADAGLVIANDSAPLHMAVGFDRPCVALFGPTDPAAVGPYGREDSVVRGFVPREGERFSHKDPNLGDSLMRLISTVAVVQKIDEVLGKSPGVRRQVAAGAAERQSSIVNRPS